MEEANEAAALGDFASAAAAMDRAAPLAPDDDQVAFRRGGVLMAVGRIDEGGAEIERARQTNPRWAVFLRRFAAAGFLPTTRPFWMRCSRSNRAGAHVLREGARY
jgi:predicted Zn-dependent protease